MIRLSFREYLSVRGLTQRGLTTAVLSGRKDDLQATAIFPLVESVEEMGCVLRWMVSEPHLEEGKTIWLRSKRPLGR